MSRPRSTVRAEAPRAVAFGRYGCVALVALALFGCAPEHVRLSVHVRSDLLPGVEVRRLQVTLFDDVRPPGVVEVDSTSPLNDPGVRALELGDLGPNSTRRVIVTAFGAIDDPVLQADVSVDNGHDAEVTVLLTRECVDVTCPPGAANAPRHCLGGRCVAAACVTGSEPACPASPECVNDADCPHEGACASPTCVQGVCFETPAEGVCADWERCYPPYGCRRSPRFIEQAGCELRGFLTHEPPCTEGCLFNAARVATSETHTCVVSDRGEIFCFGTNDRGGLGTGDAFGRVWPTRVPLPGLATDVAVGDGFSCAVLEDARIMCWGDGRRGALRRLDRRSSLVPVAAELPTTSWERITAGPRTLCAISTRGRVRCWGDNASGQAGDTGLDILDNPFPIAEAVGFRDVSVASEHACATSIDGEVWCWGLNVGGAVTLVGGGSPAIVRPTRLVGDQWERVSCAGRACCATWSDGALYCWGEQTDGSLDLGPGNLVASRPRRTGAESATDVALGPLHGCSIADGYARCWGRGDEGQRGRVGSTRDALAVSGGPWAQVAMGTTHTFFLHEDGSLFVAGERCGGLGLGDLATARDLTRVTR